MQEANRDVLEIFGAKIDRISKESAIERIIGWVDKPIGSPRFVVATGFHGLWVGHQNPAFLKILNSSDMFCPDGIAPVWLSQLQGNPLTARVPGPCLMEGALKRMDCAKYSSFFYGDVPNTLTALENRMKEEYPSHRIAGMYSPPFRPLTDQEDEQIVQQINQARPDVLWVALGLPKQEMWIHEHLDRLEVPVVIGVGAAFQFLSGMVPRAPKWIGDKGFEWAWRLGVEPKKMWRRVFIDGPQFLCHALLEQIRGRSNSYKS